MRKILLHVCCAPCSGSVLPRLQEAKDELGSESFEVVFLWFNPNIYPESEMRKRLEEVRGWAEKNKVELVEKEYDHDGWLEKVKDKKQEREGGERCEECYRMRLEKTAEVAKQMGIPYFGTTLTNSRHKKAGTINPIGIEVAKKWGVVFFEADWKKGGGEIRSVEISKKEGFYRQEYCGCEYSIKKKDE